ncbi:MAG: SGNH/GDSL hydrolase family protein [Hyphomicrobiaceae bacterium]
MALLAGVPRELSSDCRTKLKAFEGKRPFKACRKALRDRRSIKVLAVGSSSTSGIGASSPVATYPVRLEANLESFLKGIDVDVIARGVPGEVGAEAADRIRLAVADLKPELVVWQVGTNDALARVDEERFGQTLRATVRWLVKNRIDVVLIDPQYVERLAADEHYTGIVHMIADIAREERVVLVNRFNTMADLSHGRSNGEFLAKDGFHLNDLGYRCMAEYAARAIVSGILDADQEAQQPAGSPQK